MLVDFDLSFIACLYVQLCLYLLGQSKRKTVKKIIVALSEKNARKAPSHQEKAILNANGLGERAVTFPAHGSASEMKLSLMR